jgi:BirA family biotin operon repressor/biotin-[acetyl-CoA-carboxylase] ligase
VEAPSAGRRKLGGILIETVMAGPTRLAVVGVGLNVLRKRRDDCSSGYACLQELGNDAATRRRLALQVAAPLVTALHEFERQASCPFAERFAAPRPAARPAINHHASQPARRCCRRGLCHRHAGSSARIRLA